MKKKNIRPDSMEIKCASCGKVTKHYVASNGDVRCLICGTVNKNIGPKKKLEVVFEADEALDKALNPEDKALEEPANEE